MHLRPTFCTPMLVMALAACACLAADAPPAPELSLDEVKAEAKRLERMILPPVGTPREAIEAIYGEPRIENGPYRMPGTRPKTENGSANKAESTNSSLQETPKTRHYYTLLRTERPGWRNFSLTIYFADGHASGTHSGCRHMPAGLPFPGIGPPVDPGMWERAWRGHLDDLQQICVKYKEKLDAAPWNTDALYFATAGASPEVEKLVRQLASGEFDEREAATKALGELAEANWERMKRLTLSDDPEVAARAIKILWAPLASRMPKQIEDAQATMVRINDRIKDVKKALEKKSVTDPEQIKDHHKYIRQLTAGRAETASRMVQMRRLLELPPVRLTLYVSKYSLPREPDKAPAEWVPWLLPVEDRLHLPVSFEFDDAPLHDAIRTWCVLTGVRTVLSKEIEEDGTCRLPVELKINDMDAVKALEWICKLTGTRCRFDEKAKEMVIEPPPKLE